MKEKRIILKNGDSIELDNKHLISNTMKYGEEIEVIISDPFPEVEDEEQEKYKSYNVQIHYEGLLVQCWAHDIEFISKDKLVDICENILK